MVLKGCFYVGASLYRLCVSNSFGGRAGFGMETSYIFPRCVLAVISLIGGVVCVGGFKACVGCEAGLPLCSVVVTILSGSGSAPQLLGWKP